MFPGGEIQKKWATSWQNLQNDCAPSKDSDQPGHLPSLIRVFAVRMKKAWALSYPLSAQRRLWSDLADAQADLSLPRVHRSFCLFCHEVAQMTIMISAFILLSIIKSHLLAISRRNWFCWKIRSMSLWAEYVLIVCHNFEFKEIISARVVLVV